MDCPACMYTTARCATCGGDGGALRSIFAHFTFWRVRRGHDGGHGDRLSTWLKGLVRRD